MFIANVKQWLIKGYLNLHLVVTFPLAKIATKHITVARIFLLKRNLSICYLHTGRCLIVLWEYSLKCFLGTGCHSMSHHQSWPRRTSVLPCRWWCSGNTSCQCCDQSPVGQGWDPVGLWVPPEAEERKPKKTKWGLRPGNVSRDKVMFCLLSGALTGVAQGVLMRKHWCCFHKLTRCPNLSQRVTPRCHILVLLCKPPSNDRTFPLWLVSFHKTAHWLFWFALTFEVLLLVAVVVFFILCLWQVTDTT